MLFLFRFFDCPVFSLGRDCSLAGGRTFFWVVLDILFWLALSSRNPIFFMMSSGSWVELPPFLSSFIYV